MILTKLGHVLNLHLHEESVTKAELSKTADSINKSIGDVLKQVGAARKIAVEAKSEATKKRKANSDNP